ncbi:MAG: redoxin domain-containing protein [Candidatus Eremiobacteraeota bacterium]|nr:redoxin domain-containing protein [Candidatus Eremiobacteraeota bacterium]
MNTTNVRAAARIMGVAALAAFIAGVSAGRVAAAPPAEGATAPLFSLQSMDGKPWSLRQTRGHIVVINFFATWCPPCRAETPSLNAAARKYAGHDVVFIGVDDAETAPLVAQFVHSKNVPYQVVMDTHGAAEKMYDVRAIPTTYVLDRNGVIRYRQVDELKLAVLDRALDAVVAGVPVARSVAATRLEQLTAGARSKVSELAAKADTTSLDEAIATGVSANKKIDVLLASDDASSISYFEQTQRRAELNAPLADAYDRRAKQPGVAAASAADDQEHAALLRGQIMLDAERFREAAAQFDNAVRLAPKDTNAYDGAYLAAYELRDYGRAVAIARAEADLAPAEPESWLTVASAENSLKHYDQALEAERRALSLASDAYARTPSAKQAAYELGRVWLKMARTQILAGRQQAAQPLLRQAAAAAPETIVAQQADEQFAAITPLAALAIDRVGAAHASGQTASPAHVYVLVRNPSAQSRLVRLLASGLPQHWLLSFCYGTVCNPFKVSFKLAGRGSKQIELLVAPLAATGGRWSMSVSAAGQPTAHVRVSAPRTQAAITVSAT